MSATLLFDLHVIYPELLLAIMSMVLLLIGVYGGGNTMTVRLSWMTLLVMALAMALQLQSFGVDYEAFGGLVRSNSFTVVMKTMVLLGAMLVLLATIPELKRESKSRFEYPVLIMLATCGLLLMVGANDLLSLYMGLELASLSLYVLAAFDSSSKKSNEAGLKYFVLGALASGMILYGSSLIYGFSGTTSFNLLAGRLDPASPQLVPPGLVVGLIMVIVGLCFKVSAVPFHMWTPDVYEGAPTKVTAFFAIAPKVAAMALFVRVLVEPFGLLFQSWQQVIVFVSVASMFIGALAALQQTNIKRLLAYSSIGHVGYALMGLTTGTQQGVQAIIIYFALYLFASAGTFACVLLMRRKGRAVEAISNLSGLSKTHPRMAFAMLLFMFSMAGIPPLAGFFGKMAIFLAVVEAGLVWLAVLGVLSSVIAAYYYLKIVKIMYIDAPDKTLDTDMPMEMKLVITTSALVTLLFLFAATPLFDLAGEAAGSLAAPRPALLSHAL